MNRGPNPPPTNGSRWVVFATWDAAGAAAPYVVEQLLAYRECGFETLVVDASPWRSPAREDDWEMAASAWRPRANIGYDFGSYLYGLTVLVEEFGISIDRLSVLLTNDSCYGPYTSLIDVFACFDAPGMPAKAVFGITESGEITRHLQSYWMYFPAGVAGHALTFLRSLTATDTRDAAINHGEVGLSKHLLAQGCALIAWRTPADVLRHYSRFHGKWLSLVELRLRRLLKRHRYTRQGDDVCLKELTNQPTVFNPTLVFGTHMHFDGLTPFVKRALLRDNPHRDPFVPAFDRGLPLDNARVAEALRDTDRYRGRYRWRLVGNRWSAARRASP